MSKSSKLQRAIDYFREAPLDEARVAHQLVREVMDERFKARETNKPAVRKRRNKQKYEKVDSSGVAVMAAVAGDNPGTME